MNQTTNTILMVRPVAFRMNEQTAVNNYYQKVIDNLLPNTVNTKAHVLLCLRCWVINYLLLFDSNYLLPFAHSF